MADIRITGRMVNFSRITFETSDLDRIRQRLTEILADDDYTGTLVIIDSTVPQELIELIQLLIEFKLQPMAAVDGVLGDDARAIQFPLLAPDQPVQRITVTSQSAEEQNVQLAKAKTCATLHFNEVLRTGQSLLEENGDIVLTASMNSGSEVIASGNIFIYGTARGRVIAGASGEQNARIFCNSLEAELISIAGTYCVADDIPREHLKKAVQIYLNQHQELVFEPLYI